MENKKPNKAAEGGEEKVKKHRKAPKRKVCQFCIDKAKDVDYKDVQKLKRYITEKGKMHPRRTSGVCAPHQRVLNIAIKRARIMALLPFKAE